MNLPEKHSLRERATAVILDPTTLGKPLVRLAGLVGCSTATISRVEEDLRQAGHAIPRRTYRQPGLARARVEAIYRSPEGHRLTAQAVAERAGCSRVTALLARSDLRRRGLGLPARPIGQVATPPPGRTSPRAGHAELRAFLETPEALDLSEREIARRFRVKPGTVTAAWVELFARRDAAARAEGVGD